MRFDKCIRKTILYRALAIVTAIPTLYITNGGNLQSAILGTFSLELVIHTIIYYVIERREEKHKCDTCDKR
jgi:uncharacterized membrane protein